jgi:hypothetical protein
LKNCGTKLNIIFPPFQHKCMAGWGTFALNHLLSLRTWLWEKRKNFVSCSLRFTDLSLHKFLDFCKRRVSCHSQESSKHIAAVLDFLYMRASFLLFNSHQEQRYKIISFQLKMNSTCAIWSSTQN